MKFINPRRFADPDAGARKLMKLANAFEPVQDGPTCVYGLWTLFPPSEIGHRWPLRATSDRGPFLYQLKGTPVEYKAGLERAIANGWLWLHESGTYVKFTEAGAAMFA
jgi:hypothetical protein